MFIIIIIIIIIIININTIIWYDAITYNIIQRYVKCDRPSSP